MSARGDHRICWLLTILFVTRELTAESARLVETWRPSAATATGVDDFKVTRHLLIRASDMSGIDADDEFAQGIIRHSEFKLCALACQGRTLPLLPKRLIFQAGAKRQGPLAHRLMPLGRFNG